MMLRGRCARAVSPAPATMRACVLLCLLVAVSLAAAAPARSSLQLGPANEDQQPFVEEVVVESSLQVRSAPPERQGRTDARISLQDGATIAKTQ